jgi:hypothetical protein
VVQIQFFQLSHPQAVEVEANDLEMQMLVVLVEAQDILLPQVLVQEILHP